jgi:hypothetical protein
MLRTRCCVRVTRTFTLTPKKEQQKSKVNFNYELISFQKFDKTSNNRIKLNAMLISPSNWRLKKIQLNHVARWKIKICTIDGKLCVGSINKQSNTVYFLLDTDTNTSSKTILHTHSEGPIGTLPGILTITTGPRFWFSFPLKLASSTIINLRMIETGIINPRNNGNNLWTGHVITITQLASS